MTLSPSTDQRRPTAPRDAPATAGEGAQRHRGGAHPRRGRIGTWVASGGLSTLLLALPAIVLFTVFAWGPILRGLTLAFQQTNLVTTRWVGFENIAKVLADPLLATAIGNTALFAGLALVIGFPVPVLFAAVMAEMRRSQQLASVLAFLPVIIPPVVSVLLFKVFYDPRDTGLLNQIIGVFGLGPVGWLQNSATAMLSLVVVVTWSAFGSATIIYLAAITTIDRALYDAAEIDGASILRRFWHVTLPQLRGTMLVLLLLQIIGTFQVFTEPFLLTSGGPNNATVTVLMLIYRYAFVYGNFGMATALSVMLALVLGIVSTVYLAVTRRWSAS